MIEACACKKRLIDKIETEIVTTNGIRHTRHECSPVAVPQTPWAKQANAGDFHDSPLTDERQPLPERGQTGDMITQWLRKESEHAVAVMRRDAAIALRELVVEEFDRRETKELVLSICGFPCPDTFERVARRMADAYGKKFAGEHAQTPALWDDLNMSAKRAWIAAAEIVYAPKVTK